MSLFKQVVSGIEYMYPAFKFQSAEHAKSMLEDGQVYLARISDFRDANNHGGTIFDDREGQVSLINAIQPSKCIGEYTFDGMDFYPERIDISVDDAYVFCCTKYFLSDSLTWAMNEETPKDCCVLITDVEEYIKRISEAHKNVLSFDAALECQYIGREIEVKSQIPYTFTQQFINTPKLAGFVKPDSRGYKEQRELRLMWSPIYAQDLGKGIVKNIDVTDLLIPVHFEGFDKNFSSLSANSVGANIITKDGSSSPTYRLTTPAEVLTPVIHNGQLGFMNTNNTLKGATISNANVGLQINGNSPMIICNVALENIERIDIVST
ncbi:hypothetical protein AYY19_00020 [Photobacterium aquimaris]|uniref:hypothetical protein n=1 Tax=Photobacterium aquimaris TaxID=512643 RepID=UPI0007EF10AF|nr:hypothetical protein [Photobacterium aquimaris]OBU18310.1 hypothetical protein AYY19_00020 [Photobacterium aquimaris]PSW00685.1 hypothetical protein CTM91_10480 [Photobacterium aquimaris]